MHKNLIAILICISFFLSEKAFAVDYATWNSLDKASNISLSGSDLIMTQTGLSVWGSARTTISQVNGKWYWEQTFTHSGIGTYYELFGVGSISADINSPTGSDTEGYALFGLGNGVLNNGGFTTCGSYSIDPGDVVGIALDVPNRIVTFYENNAALCSSGIGGSGAIYAMSSVGTLNDAITANFGASSLIYTPPTGYSSGFFDTGSSTPTPPPTLPDFPIFDDSIYDGCSTVDIICFATSTFGFLFSYDQNYLSSSTDYISYTVVHKFPIGYITDIVSIMSTTTEGTLAVIDATTSPALGFGQAHIKLDLSHVFDFVLYATTSSFTNASASSTDTFFEITDYYWRILLYISVVIYILYRLFPSLIHRKIA